jgi:glucokinase
MGLTGFLTRGRAGAGGRDPAGLALVGDIGGTNARFGLVDTRAGDLRVTDHVGYLCRDYPEALDAVAAYLKQVGLKRSPALAAVAVAGPVEDGAIRFTNSAWILSEAGLRGMGFAAARLLNDYAALALAAPLLAGDDVRRIGDADDAVAGRTVAVLGPGTGFGASALVRDAFGEAALSGEGGHVSFAPTDEVEVEILRGLAAKYGRVSVERILSGPGLCDLHQILCALAGAPTDLTDPAEITRLALAGDPACRRTLDRFCAILGGVAGDLALGYGARGGVFIAGGIAPRIVQVLEQGDFRRRFEAKGRFESYMRAIPTRVIVRTDAALLGAARALKALTAR